MANDRTPGSQQLNPTRTLARRLLAREAWARQKIGRGTSGPGTFAAALLARLGSVTAKAGPAGTLLRQPLASPSAAGGTVNRHAHWRVTVAPRLSLTLLTLSTPSPAAAQGRANWAAAAAVDGTLAWRVTRPPGNTAAKGTAPPSHPRIVLPAVASAAKQTERASARATAVPMVQQRPFALGQQGFAEPGVPAIHASPPAAPARIVHRASAATADSLSPVAGRDARSAQVAPSGWPAAWERPQTALIPLAADTAAISRIADTVMLQLDRRMQAYRERTGRA